jgi:ribonuclease R
MNHHDLADAILAHVSQPNYQPVKPRVILKQLGLPDDMATDLRRTIKRLAKKGKLTYGEGHLVRPAQGERAKPADANRVTGTFRRMERGFGFVTPAGGGPRDKDKDIYISERSARDAASGDTVLVRLKGRPRMHGGKPGLEGEIVEIVERQTHHFVGTYEESAGQAFVTVDGMPFTRPILVGDPGAKNARPNDKVVIELVRFPSHIDDGEGVITKVLGPRGQPGVDTLSIIHEFNLPGDFAADALEESRRQAEQFDESIGEGRSDLTEETIITIDPVDARDFDDAISLARTSNGHWLLGVHIADVSHFVQPKTALDREARDRATSVYLPDRVIPMLPEIISNNLASLQPNKVRYAKTAIMEFTGEGVPVHTEYKSSAIRSVRRFTYEEVDEFLADRTTWKAKLTPAVFDLLERMHELAMILRKRRIARGAIELSMQEVKIDLNRDGQVSGAHLVVNTESHQIIEEFMLAANEAVAQLLKDADVLFLRRVHQAPDPRKSQALTEFVHELGLSTGSLESRFEIQRVLEQVKGQTEERAVNYAVLRSMQQAVYSPDEEGHYALASEHYCHFTSPIRRYPDLTVHRLLDQLAAKRKPRNDLEELASLGQHCSSRERRAEAAERELVKVKLLDYMSQRIGEELDAVVTGVQQFGMFAQGIEIPAEGLIHISSLQDDYYRYDKATHSLTGFRSQNAFRLGDVVRVAVARVDVDRRELDLRVVGRTGKTADRAARTGERGLRREGEASREARSRGRREMAKKSGAKKAGGPGEKSYGKKSGKADGGTASKGKRPRKGR